jgi:hypothetical protein
VVRGDRRAVGGFIENLSLGGALLRTADLLGRKDALDIELRVPQCAHLRVTGEAVRVERRENGPRIAVRFTDISPDAEDAIENEVLAALDAARARPVLLVDGDVARRTLVADSLRARGLTPIVPRTPLEVVDTLVGRRCVELCVLSQTFGGLRGAEVSHFITELFPWVRIMVVGDDPDLLAEDVDETWNEIQARGW